MFTKNQVSALVRSILLVAFIMGLLGLHPSQTALAAGRRSGENVVTVQKNLAVVDALPDLIIESITPTPANPATNESVVFSVVIKNQGQAAAGSFFIDLFIDQALPTNCSSVGTVYFDITGLAAGASQTVVIKYTGFTADGLHTINGIVDTNCEISESDENNNTKVTTINSVFAIGSGIYDDSNPAWNYTGSWTTYSGGGPYNNTLHYSTTTGSYAEVIFYGAKIKLTYLKAPSRGSIAVYIDNMVTPVTTLNANSSTTVWQATWISSVLSTGVHTVRFQNAGAGRIDLDAVTVVPPVTSGIYDDNDPAWSYSGSWLTYSGGGPYNNTLHYSTTTGSYAEVAFNGTQFKLTYLKAAVRGSIAVYIDNFITPVITLNANSSTTVWQATWTSAILTPGVHTVRFQNAGGRIDLDAIQIYAPVTAGIYDDSTSAWTYSGSWAIYSGGGPYLNTLHYSTTTGNYAEVTFSGTQVKLTYLKAPNRGSIAVYIDNMSTPVTTLNANSSTTLWQSTWTSALLTPGVHTIRFKNAGGRIDLDAVTVIAPDTIVPAAITTLAATTGTGNGVVNLNWTAVGDDSNTGTATSYLVRYASSPISDETAWNNATVVSSGIPTPKAAGQPESMTVTGLIAEQVYYFAVRAQDEQPNLGGLSNSPSATASSIPAVGSGTYDDSDLSAWSYTGSWAVYSGGGPYLNTLHYSTTTGNYAEVVFNGTQVKLTYLKAAARGSIAVYIDNMVTPVTTLNANSATTLWQSTWTSAVLESRVHTIRFKNAGGGRIDLDAVTVIAPDDTAPAAITTLAATTGTGNGVVNLNWTAVGDDDTTGTATSYLVRYATSAILTDTDWDNATPVTSGLPTPKAAGQPESMTVTGLIAEQVYYFAVRAQDEYPHLGALSNSPSATASSIPAVGSGTYDDSDLSAWSYTGTWLTYNGGGPYLNTLHYSSTTGNYADVTFNGTQVTLIYLKAAGRGSIAIYIDNMDTPVTTLNSNSSTTLWQSTWTSAVLESRVHTIRFKNAGGGRIDLDAVTVP